MELPNLLLDGFHQCPFQLLQSLKKKAADQNQNPSSEKNKWKKSSYADNPFKHPRFPNNPFLPNSFLFLASLLQSLMRKTGRQSRAPNKKEKLKSTSLLNDPFLHFGFQPKFDLPNLLVLLLLLVFALQPVSSLSSNQSHRTTIAQSDYRALLAFKHALIDPRGVLLSWNDTGLHACSGGWGGIKCIQGRVVTIQLPSKRLSGQISDKIGQLKALRKLSLHDNLIKGRIPLSLGLLPKLRAVSLFNNRLSGSIPPSIWNCPLLRNLDLGGNLLSGAIPDSLSNATRLYRLNLSYNSLTGPIPYGLTHSTSLVFLALQHNNLSGSIPSLGGLGMLEEISLSRNNFKGSIPEDIGMLSRLRSLDLSNNNIGGNFPISLCNLSTLVRLNLENNHLKGQIPEALEGMRNLSVLILRRNQFEGQIPSSLGNISGLLQLDLSENNLAGKIPISVSNLPDLESFNVSYNNLSGSVPLLLSKKFNSSSFKGNLQLCGYSGLVPCPPSPPISSPPQSITIQENRSRPRLRIRYIILISAALFLLLCSILLCLVKKRANSSLKSSSKSTAFMGRGEKGRPVIGTEVESGGEAGGKLVHFDGPLVFTADDLLCATAEIMGKSNYGTVYKATLEDGNQVAVKRLKEKIAKNGSEFEEEAYALGKIRHPNLLALRAYYLGPKGEKLLVFDYMPRGSLASFLHARGQDMRINWATRLKIAVDTTRGLCYLHVHENMVHGNLTSGNILLDERSSAKITDFGLARLMTSSSASDCDVVATAGTLGYRAPELSKLKTANRTTDVYSLGVILLELLTGRSPCEAIDGYDLPQWVASIVKEEWTNEVFDLDLTRDASSTATEDELLNALNLALHCVDPSPAARPNVQQVLQHLQEIKPESAAEATGSGNNDAGVPYANNS